MKKEFKLEEILKHVEKPGRYLGGEWNEVKKSPHKAKAKVALVFPDLYEIGMSYLGQKIIYSLLNNHPHILAERVYAPWIDFEEELRSKRLPLFSLENKIPLYEFDLIGFSLLYELNYSNILTILELGQIPLLSSERDLKFPLVIGGGPAVFNPEPVASIFDLFSVGDGEESFIEIIEKFIFLKKELKEKEAVLREMTKIKGVYVPSLYKTFQPSKSSLLAVKPADGAPAKIQKRILFDLKKTSFPENVVVPSIKTVFDRVSVEIARGCPQKCRFCQAASIYFPYRIKNPSLVIQNIMNSLNSTGYGDASLASLSVTDYPYLDKVIESLMQELAEQRISLSLPSLRPGGLSSELAENIIKVRKTGFTLVPEAGTERLRRVINKNLEDQEIFNASSNAFSLGWRLLKLYFMVGLPTERDEDLEGIIRMVQEIIKFGTRILGFSPRINLSISSFIPKPHTPFQWLKMEEEEILREKHLFLKSSLRSYPQIKFKDHPLKSSVLEAVFSRGDRRLSDVLLKAWENGARFDSWNDKFNFRTWRKTFESEKLNYHLYLGPLSKKELLPWDHIDCGLKKSHLLQELRRALSGERTPSCLDERCGRCQGCSFWPQLEKEFKEKIKFKSEKLPSPGKETENVYRYRVFYSKLHQARFLSHLDLSSIIQRALRRGGFSVLYSEGFHPKIRISFCPALPLGMEAKAEVLEFKSRHLYTKEEFLRQINKFLPPGIKFLRLKRLKASEPSLDASIENMVYSFDLKNQEINDALEELDRERKMASTGRHEVIQRLVDEFLNKNRDESIEDISLDEKKGKLYISLNYYNQKRIRPQEIIKNICGINNSVFYMTREKIVFKLTRERDSSIRTSKNLTFNKER